MHKKSQEVHETSIAGLTKKKFLFATNRPNLRSKLLVVGTLDPISKNSLNLAVWKCSRSTTKICCWISEKDF